MLATPTNKVARPGLRVAETLFNPCDSHRLSTSSSDETLESGASGEATLPVAAIHEWWNCTMRGLDFGNWTRRKRTVYEGM